MPGRPDHGGQDGIGGDRRASWLTQEAALTLTGVRPCAGKAHVFSRFDTYNGVPERHGGLLMQERARLTPALIEELRRRVNPETGKPYNLAQIARMFGVSREYVSRIRREGPYYKPTPRQLARAAFPWDVPTEMQNTWLDHVLRDHGEYIATGGRGMQEWKLRQLNDFYDRLERDKVVVEFDPHADGYAYRKRRPSDGDLIIRVNRHTKLTEHGKRIWRMPPRRPAV